MRRARKQTCPHHSGLPTSLSVILIHLILLSPAVLHAEILQESGSLLGFLCGLTRANGFLIAIPLCVEIARTAFRECGSHFRIRPYLKLSLAFTPIAGLALFATFIFLHSGSFLSILHIQTAWNRTFGPEALLRFLSPGYHGFWTGILAATFGIALIPFLFRKLPLSLALYGLSMVLLPLSTGSFLSYSRFIAISFPHFIVLSRLLEKRPVFWAGFFTSFACFQIFLSRELMKWTFWA